jgi:hypothetical protein
LHVARCATEIRRRARIAVRDTLYMRQCSRLLCTVRSPLAQSTPRSPPRPPAPSNTSLFAVKKKNAKKKKNPFEKKAFEKVNRFVWFRLESDNWGG